uniref:Ig-like domain-containing protein n=1 Tax=Gopherus evgoodei TaxID=1825980 RepID=A0A8C4Y4H9_9SAUR
MACLLPTAEPSYPKPNISGIPSRGVSVGEAMAIWCRRQRQGVRFVLNKEGRHFPPVDSDGFGAVFPISNVSREDGGSYSCSYHSRSEPFAVSDPSDPVELVVYSMTGTRSKPDPSRVIAPGGAVTIRCPCEARRLFLYKDGIEIQELDAAGGGGQFTIPSARREDGGAYTCRSRSTSEPPNWSDPSDIVRIIVVGEGPCSVSLLPAPLQGAVTVPGAVTVQCRGRHQNAMFLLYKDGNLNALQDVELAGNLAEFSFRNVSRRDAGSYSCYYHDKRYQFTWSYPSDPVELVVAGEGPSSVSLLPGVSLGESVSIWCKGQHRGVRFVLNKDGRHFPPVDSDGFGAVFAISNVSREDGGSYSCSYHSRSEPFAVSYPSNPVELVVRGEGLGSASPFPAQPPARPSRGSLPMGRSEPGSALSPDPTEGMPGRGAGTESLGSPARGESQLTQTQHLSEPHWGHGPRSRCHHPVSGAAPGREVLPVQGWRPEPAATYGPWWGRGRVPHPQRGSAAGRELQLQLPAPVRALRLLAAQRTREAGGSR